VFVIMYVTSRVSPCGQYPSLTPGSVLLLCTSTSTTTTMLSRTRLPARTIISRHANHLPQVPLARRTISSSPAFFNDNFYPSPPPPPPPKNPFLARARLVGRYGAYLVFSSVLGVGLVTGGIFLHDAFTYNSAHADRVPVNPLALNPERGGPKNLPIVRVNLGDEEDEEMKKLATKPKLVIVGAGWGVSARAYSPQTRVCSLSPSRQWVFSRA
jgi:hypothetical protein